MSSDAKGKCCDYLNAPKEFKLLLDRIANNFKTVLKHNLLGIYLHGSLAIGGFLLGKSDVDIIIVVRKALSNQQRKDLAKICLIFSKQIGGKGLEMSVILEKYAKTPVYSMPFEFHYSETWRSKYERGFTGPFLQGDPDLSAHLRVLTERGITLYGKPIAEIFGTVSAEDYLKALLNDLEDVPKMLYAHPAYYVLNLCRVLGFIQTGKVMSKKEGGEWYIASEERFRNVVTEAMKSYSSLGEPNFDSKELERFARFMLDRIGASIG